MNIPKKSIIEKVFSYLFPFIPLVIAILIINHNMTYAEPDAQAPIAYMLVIVLAILAMLLFTVAGLVYLSTKQKNTNYYRITFIVLSLLNIPVLFILLIFEMWPFLLSSLLLLFTGTRVMLSEKKKHKNAGTNH